MERRSADSRLHTIRGKIWMMVILLAVTNCVCGAIVFVAASLLTSASWIPVVLSITVSTATTIAFASWISGDVLRPLDKLNLLAKSIERSPGMSIPKTTGALETDDLLHTISRASRQLTNFIDLMDEVTAGNTKAVLDPLEHSDRLSESFRKLVAKVTDSIDAKAELNQLQQAVNQISSELSGLNRGELVRVRNTFEGTKVITDALRLLIEKQSAMVHTVGSNVSEMRSLVSEGRSRTSLVLDKDASRGRGLKKLVTGLTASNVDAEKTIRDAASSLTVIDEAIKELGKDVSNAEESTKSHAAVRKQFEAAIHKLRDVGEQSLAVTHVAKAVQDLAKRSNMIALNASIQAKDTTSGDLAALTQEIISLSERAEKANKAIAGISDSVVRDVNEASASLHWLTSEVAKVYTRTRESEESIDNVRTILAPLAELRSTLEKETKERSERVNKNLKVLEEFAAQSDEILADLQSCESTFALLHDPIEAIRGAVGATRNFMTLTAQGGGAAPAANGSKHSKNGSAERELATIAGE